MGSHPVLRPAAEAEADLSRTLESLRQTRNELRGQLGIKVVEAAAAASAEAQRMGIDPSPTEGDGDGDGSGEDMRGTRVDVDALVTRLAALHSARDLLVSQLRVEGALQEAQGILSSARWMTVSGGGGSDAAMLDTIEAGAAALRNAARGIVSGAAASNPSPTSSSQGIANSSGRKRNVTATAPAPDEGRFSDGRDPGESRFSEAATSRLARMAADMRGPTASALVAAAAAAGWPPSVNPAALDAFTWNPAVHLRLGRAAAALQSLQDAAAEAGTTDSWVAEALAGPVQTSLRRHFTGPGVAADPSRPERLFVCAAKVAGRLAPMAGAVLPANGGGGGGGGGDETRRETHAAAAKRVAGGFTSAVAAAAVDIVREHLLPACARGDAAARTPNAATDTPWLHLADEAAQFDKEIAVLLQSFGIDDYSTHIGAGVGHGDGVGTRGVSAAGSGEPTEVRRSALAALMTTEAEWGERWMAAELSDCLRALDLVCDAPDDAAGLGVRGSRLRVQGVRIEV